MNDHDALLADLAALDPAHAEGPPPPGSPRDRQILETAMTPTDPTAVPVRTAADPAAR